MNKINNLRLKKSKRLSCKTCKKHFWTKWPRAKYCSKYCQHRRPNKPRSWIIGNNQPKAMHGRWGASGELLTSADLLSKGFYTYSPADLKSPYDLLALGESGKIYRVEVKRGRLSKNGRLVAFALLKHPVDFISIVIDKIIYYFEYKPTTTFNLKDCIDPKRYESDLDVE